MSDRPLIAPNFNKPLISAGDMSADITGPATIIQRLPGISYDLAWTGTPTGTFLIQVSNTYAQNADGSVANAGNWSDLPSSAFVGTIPAPAGSSGTGFIDVMGTEAYAVRIKYTYSSGSGSLTVYACAKVW